MCFACQHDEFISRFVITTDFWSGEEKVVGSSKTDAESTMASCRIYWILCEYLLWLDVLFWDGTKRKKKIIKFIILPIFLPSKDQRGYQGYDNKTIYKKRQHLYSLSVWIHQVAEIPKGMYCFIGVRCDLFCKH